MPTVDFSDDVYHDLDEDTDTYIDNDSNDNPEFREKEKQILAALSSEPADTERLKQLAISPEGLLTDELRKLAWPKLINIDVDNILLKPGKVMLQICYRHVIFVSYSNSCNCSLQRTEWKISIFARYDFQNHNK